MNRLPDQLCEGNGTDVLLGQEVDQRGQDVLLHHGLGHEVAEVRQVSQSQSRRLPDAGDHVQHQGAQLGQHACGGEKPQRGQQGAALVLASPVPRPRDRFVGTLEGRTEGRIPLRNVHAHLRT